MAYLLNSKLTFFFLILSVSWLSLEARTGEIEEIVVKGTWRQAELKDSYGSVVILDQELLKSQPIKHFEQLSFFYIQIINTRYPFMFNASIKVCSPG